MGLEILVDNPAEITEPGRGIEKLPGNELTSWVVGRVGPWRDYRNRLPEAKRWAEYWRMWRGYWADADRNRKSERSRLIAPALAQAVETSVAEIEETLLSREVWFDIEDDLMDEEKLDATLMRDQLREDMDLANTKSVLSEAVTNAALMGTGIVKLNVDTFTDKQPGRNAIGQLEGQEVETVRVTPESIRPDQFIPDPAATTVDAMLGCAIEYRNKPVVGVLEKIRQETYREDALPFIRSITSPRTGDEADFAEAVTINDSDTDAVHLVEYHGKVPLFLLEKANGSDNLVDALLAEDFKADGDEGPLVEAIVTIANESVLLRAIANPFIKTDRSVIAFCWENVPGHFWGRSVSEKGYNPQKALDAELRARVDALGFVSAPMLGMDAGRIPRGFKPEVKPGKVWLTNGNPSEVLQPVGIGQVDPNTFNHSGELQQMVQMGTGAFDTATTLRGTTGSGGNAATGGSMMLGAFVKRSKRSVSNIERNLIMPFIKATALRYLQFNPSRYPWDDTKFIVKGQLGIIAREIEQINITQLIGMLPEDAVGAKLAAAQGFVDMSSVVNKAQIMEALKQDQETLAARQEQQAEQQKKIAELEEQVKGLELESITVENQKVLAEIREILAKAEVAERKADTEDVRTNVEVGKLAVARDEVQNNARQNDINEMRLELQRQQVRQKAASGGN
jgi:hypothetical protein